MARPEPDNLSLLVFLKSVETMLGEVRSRLLLRFELLRGMFFLRMFYLTKLTGPFLDEVSDLTLPPAALLPPTDCDLLLAESTLLPLPLPTE